jgi:hypothetical protein
MRHGASMQGDGNRGYKCRIRERLVPSRARLRNRRRCRIHPDRHYHMIEDRTTYQGLGGNHFERRLANLGYAVERKPLAA